MGERLMNTKDTNKNTISTHWEPSALVCRVLASSCVRRTAPGTCIPRTTWTPCRPGRWAAWPAAATTRPHRWKDDDVGWRGRLEGRSSGCCCVADVTAEDAVVDDGEVFAAAGCYCLLYGEKRIPIEYSIRIHHSADTIQTRETISLINL